MYSKRQVYLYNYGKLLQKIIILISNVYRVSPAKKKYTKIPTRWYMYLSSVPLCSSSYYRIGAALVWWISHSPCTVPRSPGLDSWPRLHMTSTSTNSLAPHILPVSAHLVSQMKYKNGNFSYLFFARGKSIITKSDKHLYRSYIMYVVGLKVLNLG